MKTKDEILKKHNFIDGFSIQSRSDLIVRDLHAAMDEYSEQRLKKLRGCIEYLASAIENSEQAEKVNHVITQQDKDIINYALKLCKNC